MTVELRGTPGRDELGFSTSDTHAIGDDGDDLISAHKWDSALGKYVASIGKNTLEGGNGNDQLTGGAGSDTLLGGAGKDRIYASLGAAFIDGGDGDDLIIGEYREPNTSAVVAGAGNHTIYGGAGDDRIIGGDGNELIYGGSGNNTLEGGNGNDLLDVSASSGSNSLHGGTGNNTIVGGSGVDDIYSGTGSAVVDGGAGNDTIQTLYYDSASKQWVLSNFAATLNGGAGDDRIYGGNGNDLLDGGSGNDLLNAGEGNDTLIGGQGNDTLVGGAGDDHYIINGRNALIYDSGGHSTIEVNVDWYKHDQASNDTYTYMPGVEQLPYWIDALTFVRQMAETGEKTVINYVFAETAPTQFNAVDRLEFSAFTAAQRVLAKQAFAYVSGLVNIEFRETTDTALDKVLVLANNKQEKSAGYGGPGKLMMANSELNLAAKPDTYTALTFMHELGHVLGLKHPFGHNDANGNVGPGPYLPAAEDNSSLTVMTYIDTPEAYSVRYSAYDVAALSFLYGPSAQRNAGDTHTMLSATSSNFITDGGGNDTLDGSAFSQALVVDLRPGYWSYIGAKATAISAPGQVTVNFGSVIENLAGGSGDDRLTGNDVDNVLIGGAGDDVLTGGLGADLLHGGSGLDTATYGVSYKTFGLVKIGNEWSLSTSVDAKERDTLNGVERLQFADAVIAISTDGLAATAELSAYTALAHKFYIAYFGRPADPAGLNSMVKQLASAHAPSTTNTFVAAYGRDATVTSIIDSFGNSAESAALYRGGTEAFISAIYSNVLGRAPDAGGLAFWSGAVTKGEITRGQVALNILAGAEVNLSQQGALDAALAGNRMLSAANFTASLDTTQELLAYSGNAAAAAMRAVLDKIGASSSLLDAYRSFDTALAALPTTVATAPAAEAIGAIGVATLVGTAPSWLDGLI
jgi:serralysin